MAIGNRCAVPDCPSAPLVVDGALCAAHERAADRAVPLRQCRKPVAVDWHPAVTYPCLRAAGHAGRCVAADRVGVWVVAARLGPSERVIGAWRARWDAPNDPTAADALRVTLAEWDRENETR